MPHDIHVIRLRGPWLVEPIERYIRRDDGRFERSTSGLPLSGRAMMPADWAAPLGPEFYGRVRYRRTFHGPTGLESGERAMLVIEPPRSRGTVALNAQPLGDVVWDGPPARFNITGMLQDRNRLEIVVEHPALDAAMSPDDDAISRSPGGLVGEVRLEIEE